MKLRYTYTIRYQDVDLNRRLKLFTLENYLLETAAHAADDLGFGIPNLMPYHYTWIVTNIIVKMDYLPTHGEQMTMETWIESNAHSLSTRDFRIYLHTDDGERLIGTARTIWAVLDLNKREIVNAFTMPMFEGSVDGETLDLSRSPRLRSLTNPTGETTHTVTYSDIDYNGHCNSCRYLEMMLNTYLPAFLKEQRQANEKTPLQLELSYAKEVYLGDALHIAYEVNDNDICYILKTTDDHTSVTCRLTTLTQQ
ncbi:MAG: hypothetical protein IJS00_00615 [Paludibacteraceae bacterium]|nr:hypothetical protein [Paludibacteraceae bacterium]